MILEVYCEEITEEIKEEMSFLYKIGVNADELEYLIRLKFNKK